jgi:catalase
MNELLVNIAAPLAQAVSLQTGVKVAPIGTSKNPTPSAPTPSGPIRAEAKDLSSPALSQDKTGDSIKGRKIAFLGGEGMEALHFNVAQSALQSRGAVMELISAHAGTIKDSAGKVHKVNRAAPNAPSVFYDAVLIAGGKSAAVLARSGLAVHFVNEAYRHGKPIASIGDGERLLKTCTVGAVSAENGIVSGDAKAAVDALIDCLLQHRFPRRAFEEVPA